MIRGTAADVATFLAQLPCLRGIVPSDMADCGG